MNEKAKLLMERQQNKVVENLSDTFDYPIFQDYLVEEEILELDNYFLIVYGNMRQANSQNQLSQEIFIMWTTENNPEIETSSIDVISTISKIPGIVFKKTLRPHLPKDGAEDKFVDPIIFRSTSTQEQINEEELVNRVTFIFERLVKYDCLF